jgi:hypothetical protein
MASTPHDYVQLDGDIYFAEGFLREAHVAGAVFNQ